MIIGKTMFTGLVETIGEVLSLEERGEQARLTVKAPFSGEVQLGDSVAINGCCLTVVDYDADKMAFDLLRQTLEVTSLGQLAAGSIVNLERALAVGARLGGHFVQGHVDSLGEVIDLSEVGQDHRYEVRLPEEIHRYCIPKGALCLDGISLTIAELTATSAVFWITPHTFVATNLQKLRVGDRINLEADMLAKYVEKLSVARP